MSGRESHDFSRGRDVKSVVDERRASESGGAWARVPPPPLAPHERRAAQDKAVAARRLRLELKEKLKAGSISLAELLEQSDTDEMVARMKVVSALESLPGLGKVKARRLMEEIGISETRRLKGLGARQRSQLLAVFEGWPHVKAPDYAKHQEACFSWAPND